MEAKEIKLEDLWWAEQSILDAIDKVCRDNNIRYTLAYGTLLGAVRHGGFIPWDDDLDVMMPREDYDKFKRIWPECAPKDYLLQDENKYADYVNTFAKIRKNNTTFLQFESERNASYHKGIFVDVFPCDRVASGWFARKLQYFLFSVNLLFNRGYTSGTKGVVGLIERFLLKVVRKKNYKKISNWAGRKSRKWNGNLNTELVDHCTIKGCSRYFPADLFDELIELEFQGKKYCAIKNYHEFLTERYGDYMQLPPEEERVWRHHPILIDFEHNYEDLVKEGKVWTQNTQ